MKYVFPKGKDNPSCKRSMTGSNNPNYREVDIRIKRFIVEHTNKHKCQCGHCDEYIKVKKVHYFKGIPRFVNWHRPRGEKSLAYGKSLSKESKQRLSNRFKGEKNPNWKNGNSLKLYPIEFNDKLKLEIRKRDNFTCQLCDMVEEEHIIVFGRVLSIHHIDYSKENCEENNLITLCNYCNSRVNFNRDYWIEYFTQKMRKRRESWL